MRLLSSQGELVRGRCGSTNQCDYCARLGAVENAELLALDAMAGSAPTIVAVLTTRTATLDMKRFYRSREHVMRALRRRWPAAEYAALVEYTTGYGPNSGGARRPHWNLLLKGIPTRDLAEATAVIVGTWCRREDARPSGQYVGEIGQTVALLRYIALHFQKSSQTPPAGWRGHRFVKSRGYLATTTPEAREAARRSLRFKRELWRAVQLAGEDSERVERLVQDAMAIADATSWELVHVNPATGAPGPIRGGSDVGGASSEQGGRQRAVPAVRGAALQPVRDAAGGADRAAASGALGDVRGRPGARDEAQPLTPATGPGARPPTPAERRTQPARPHTPDGVRSWAPDCLRAPPVPPTSDALRSP